MWRDIGKELWRQVLSPLAGESQREGALWAITLSCILSPQGRGGRRDTLDPPLGLFSL